MPTAVAGLEQPLSASTTHTTLVRWFEPAAAPTEAASSRSTPLALHSFDGDDDADLVASLCSSFIARHSAAAKALKGDANKAADRARKSALSRRMEAHKSMVERASDGCGVPAKTKYPGSGDAQRCLCVALETLPRENSEPELRVMRILVSGDHAGEAFVADVRRAASEAVAEVRRARPLAEAGREAQRSADAEKHRVMKAHLDKVVSAGHNMPISSNFLFSS